MTWVDGFVVLTLGVAFWGGYRNGVIAEAIGMVAIIAAWVLAGGFAGMMAPAIGKTLGLAPASAHLASFWLLFLFAFAVTRALGWFAERSVSKPVLKVAGGVGGGLVASAKAVLALWLILFIGLFFPIAPDVRTTLRDSPSVRLIESLDKPAYAAIYASLPWRARPFAHLFLKNHHL